MGGQVSLLDQFLAALRGQDEQPGSDAVPVSAPADESAIEELLAALQEPGGDAHLIQLGAQAIEPLTAALQDKDYVVGQSAVEALAKIGNRSPALAARVVPPLVMALRRKELAQAAGQALAGLGEPAIAPLVAALCDEEARSCAAQTLVRIGQPSVGRLVAALKDDDAEARQAAALALGYIQDARAVQPLLAALQDGSANVRQAAAEGLGYIRDASAVQPLAAALRDGDARVRESAALSLGALADERAVEALLFALQDAESAVRQAAARALGQAGSPRAVQPLEAFCAAACLDGDRRAAEYALDLLGPRTVIAPRGQGKILIVEDDADQANILKIYFSQQGYGIMTLGRGQTALERCKRYLPDLVLLDILLPDTDGYQICSQLRADLRTRHVIIFFLTQKREKADKIAGLELEADDYITKPFDMDELYLRVRGAIRRAHSEGLINPVSGLPGGRLIEEQMRSLAHRTRWNLLYVGVDHLEPFTARYGRAAGDGALHFTAQLMGDVVDQFGAPDDFIGHVGGSQFIVITSSGQAQAIQQALIRRFNAQVGALYRPGDRQGGRLLFDGQVHPSMALTVEILDPGEDVFAAMRASSRVIAELRRAATSAGQRVGMS